MDLHEPRGTRKCIDSIHRRLLELEEDIISIRAILENTNRKSTLSEINAKLDTLIQLLMR